MDKHYVHERRWPGVGYGADATEQGLVAAAHVTACAPAKPSVVKWQSRRVP
jgi:hypothetical protein